VRRRGKVYIAPVEHVPADGSMVDPETALFWCSWQDDDEALEDVDLDGAEAAIAWGRERSSVVLIRLGNRGDTYFSSGEEHPDQGEYDPLPIWPPSAPPAEGWWDPVSGHRNAADLSERVIITPEEGPGR
jgi:hypothetical protein